MCFFTGACDSCSASSLLTSVSRLLLGMMFMETAHHVDVVIKTWFRSIWTCGKRVLLLDEHLVYFHLMFYVQLSGVFLSKLMAPILMLWFSFPSANSRVRQSRVEYVPVTSARVWRNFARYER